MKLQNKKFFIVGWIIVFLPFIISLTMPVYCVRPYEKSYDNQCGETWQGLFMFMLGWLGYISTTTWAAWFANPLMFFAFGTSFIKPYISLLLSGLALFLALRFLDGGDFVLNEGGAKAYVSEYLIGYWYWLSSIALSMVLSLILTITYFVKKKAVKNYSNFSTVFFLFLFQ